MTTTSAAWTFEVAEQDCFIQIREDDTLFRLMQTVCDAWLNDARDGDGGVFDHLWRVSHASSGRAHVGPFEDFSDGVSETVPETAENSTLIRSLNLSPGQLLEVEYDFGSTTRFVLKAVKKEDLSAEDASTCPRKVSAPGAVSTIPSSSYTPPVGTPTLDDLFPNASKLLFDSIAKWILLFPLSDGCSAAVEAGPNAMGDMVFAPHPFVDVEELLLALDEAGTKSPDQNTRADAFSRMVFPANMTPEQERNYQLFKDDLDQFEAAVAATGQGPMSITAMVQAGLSEEHMYRMCGPKECVVRLLPGQVQGQVSALRSRGFDFDKAFPKTSAAYKSDDFRWISYRRGVLQLCRGDGMMSGDRGIPPPGGVVARLEREISSLQELFCAAESLWP